jgi:hypothetical protein
MAIQIAPRFDAESLSSGSRGDGKRGYFILGTSDAIDARDALRSFVAPAFDGNELDNIDVKRVSTEIWEGDVSYISPERKGEKEDQVKEIGDSTYSFEIGGGTFHITHSEKTVAKYTRATFPANFGGAIGADYEGNVAGVDIETPVYDWSEEHKVPVQLVTPAWRKAVARMVGRMNQNAFRTFAPGEVKFGGCSGNKSDKESVTLSFKFSAQENATADNPIIIEGFAPQGGGGDHRIQKLGWDYLWMFYTPMEDTQAKLMVQKLHSAFVERIRKFADFSFLGIGT